MQYLIMKYLITAAAVVVISEFAKRSDRLGSLLTALPLVALLTLIWLYVEHQPASKLANYAFYTFWYVLPTLPMFLFFAYVLPKWGFITTLIASVVLTMILFFVFALVMKQFDIHLM